MTKLARLAISRPLRHAAPPNTGNVATAANTCRTPGTQIRSDAFGRTARSALKDRIGSVPQFRGEVVVEIQAGMGLPHHAGTDDKVAERLARLPLGCPGREQWRQRGDYSVTVEIAPVQLAQARAIMGAAEIQ